VRVQCRNRPRNRPILPEMRRHAPDRDRGGVVVVAFEIRGSNFALGRVCYETYRYAATIQRREQTYLSWSYRLQWEERFGCVHVSTE